MASKWPARIAGGAAGLANGLFGGGGGMVFLPILSHWGNLKSRQLYATCVAVIFPVCAVSAAMYLWRGGMIGPLPSLYLTGGLLGGWLGGKLYGRVSQSFEVDLRRLSLLRGGEVSAVTDWLLPFLCGLGAAVISAWGVGGGTLLLLVMTLLLTWTSEWPRASTCCSSCPQPFPPCCATGGRELSGYTHTGRRRPRGCPSGTCRSMDRHSGGCGPAAPPLRYLPAALRSFS